MNKLSQVFIFKIAATVLVWCTPLILMPASWIEALGLPSQESLMFVRMLGWAYLALCVGYWFGLRESLEGRRPMGPIWVGIVSNGGACAYLVYFGMKGAWDTWGSLLQIVGWGSAVATLLITLGLYVFGVRGDGDAV